jgi:hypothetical protein
MKDFAELDATEAEGEGILFCLACVRRRFFKQRIKAAESYEFHNGSGQIFSLGPIFLFL